jgi:hypothetical protein
MKELQQAHTCEQRSLQGRLKPGPFHRLKSPVGPTAHSYNSSNLGHLRGKTSSKDFMDTISYFLRLIEIKASICVVALPDLHYIDLVNSCSRLKALSQDKKTLKP